MKKIVNFLLVLLIVATILGGCGSKRLSGKYIASDKRVLVFSGSDKVTLQNYKGTYKIENGKITLIFSGQVQEYSFTQVSKSLVIDGVEYKKSK